MRRQIVEKVVYVHPPVQLYADMDDLGKAHYLEKLALEIAQRTEAEMRSTIRWAAIWDEHIKGLQAEAQRLRHSAAE